MGVTPILGLPGKRQDFPGEHCMICGNYGESCKCDFDGAPTCDPIRPNYEAGYGERLAEGFGMILAAGDI